MLILRRFSYVYARVLAGIGTTLAIPFTIAACTKSRYLISIGIILFVVYTTMGNCCVPMCNTAFTELACPCHFGVFRWTRSLLVSLDLVSRAYFSFQYPQFLQTVNFLSEHILVNRWNWVSPVVYWRLTRI